MTNRFLPLFTASVTVGVLTTLWLWRRRREKELLPMNPASMTTTMAALGSAAAPEFVVEQARQLGCNNFRLRLPINAVIIGDGDLQRALFLAHEKPYHLLAGFDLMGGGKSVFTKPNPTALPLRKKLLSVFGPKQVQAMNDLCLRKIEDWMATTLAVADEVVFDPALAMLDLTLSVICEALFLYPITIEEGQALMADVEQPSREFAMRQASQPWRPYLTWVLPERRRALAAAKATRERARKMLHHYRTLPNPDPSSLIALIDRELGLKTDEEKIPDMLTFLIAGHETTAYSLATTLLHLAKYETEQDRLRAQLWQTPREEWAKLDAFQWAAKESMRLKPTAALISMRETKCDFPTKDGLVPKGTTVFLTQMLSTRDPAIFEAPEEYRPTRWAQATPEMNQAILPFGSGPRRCPGEPLALAEMHNVLPRLLADYRFTVVDEGHFENHITYKPIGVRLRATKVKP